MKKILMTAAAGLIATAGMVSAASLSISGGTAGTIPGGDASNEVLDALVGFGGEFTNPLNGVYGGVVTLSHATKLRIEHVGYEAAFINEFRIDDGSGGFASISTGGGKALPTSLTSSYETIYANASEGIVRFGFLTPDAVGSSSLIGDPYVANIDGQDNTPGFVNFFSYAARDGSIWLWLDDTGAGVDDNHDDMVVRISVVPLPAGGVLLLTGLAGFGAMRRRKKIA
jgi:hypothetical protein